mgnify:CR=1 FL=1
MIVVGDALDVLATMADGSVDCCVTSPPYFGLRDYSCEGQIGLEPTLDEYVAQEDIGEGVAVPHARVPGFEADLDLVHATDSPDDAFVYLRDHLIRYHLKPTSAQEEQAPGIAKTRG